MDSTSSAHGASTTLRAQEGWQLTVSRLPQRGGTYLAGCYDVSGPLPKHFVRFWATLYLFIDGHEWVIADQQHKHRSVDYWIEIPPHPNHLSERIA